MYLHAIYIPSLVIICAKVSFVYWSLLHRTFKGISASYKTKKDEIMFNVICNPEGQDWQQCLEQCAVLVGY